MADRHTSGSIAAMLGAELLGRADLPISHLESLDRGGPGALSFIRSGAFAEAWASSGVPAALVTRGVSVPGHDPSSRALLVVPDADRALLRCLQLFAPRREPARAGVHPSAMVDPSARLAPGASIGPCCVVGAGASIAEGAVLEANITVGRGASIGRGTVLHPGVVVGDRCIVGDGCTIWSGVVIGADGFGYLPADDGRGVVKVPHIGHVEVGDDVEIGANSCIDRGKFGATEIGRGTKIDNLVQIGHNCRIGRACLVCGKAGLAGSVTIGDGVILAADVGVIDGIRIGAGARVGGRSAVINDIPAGETWLGQPAMPAVDATRNYAAFRNLAELARTVRRMQKKIDGAGDA